VTAPASARDGLFLRAAASPVLAGGRRVLEQSRFGPPLKKVAALLLVVLALRVVFFGNPAPSGVLLYGAIIGLLYALLAFGLILVYRATRIINFAQAEIGAAAAVLAVILVRKDVLPYLVALPLALLVGLLSGGLVEVGVVRRFAKAPRLVLSVATIGVSLVFGAFQLILPVVFGETNGLGLDTAPIRTPFSGLQFTVFPIVFDANTIVIIMAAALVLAGLTAFFKFTDIGFAVRAAAENSDRAVLLGIPVARVSSVVWMLAGALSALGIFLRVPLIGLPVGASVGPFVLLYALAAAVIARMEKFSTALVAAVALGMTEQAIYFSTRDPNVGVAITLPVLLAAMLFQRKSLSRGQDTGIASWSLAKDHRLTPPELRGLREVRWGSRGFQVLAVVAALLLPLVLGPTQEILVSVVVIYGIVGISLVILTGWSGQISLGQWGFGGLGAAIAGGLSARLSADFFVAVLVAGLVGAVVAVIIGLPALRIQGLYLAVTTLAFALSVQVFVLNPSYFGWLLPETGGSIERPIIFERFDTASPRAFYYLTLIFFVLCLLSARALRQSRAGRLMIAVRDNQRGAQAYGVSTRRIKLWAFAISGFWAAVAGALFVFHQGALDNSAYGVDLSLTLLVIVVIGGSTSLPGAVIGTMYLGLVRYSGLPVSVQLLASGAGALVLLYLLPGGLSSVYYGIRDRLLKLIANRRGILVPSLLADVRAGSDKAPGGGDAHAKPESVDMDTTSDRDLGSISLAATIARTSGVALEDSSVRCPVCDRVIPVQAAPYHEHLSLVTK
jgi:branched-chain amino acid transport system permease protein